MPAPSSRTRRRERPGLLVRLAAWCSLVGALAAALLSFWTGGVHLAALAVLAALLLVSLLRGGPARDPLGPLAGFLAPAIAVGVVTGSALGALEGLLWGGFVRLFLLEQSTCGGHSPALWARSTSARSVRRNTCQPSAGAAPRPR